MWEIAQEVVLTTKHWIRFDRIVHGHTWTVRAVVKSSHLDANGWVMDLYTLKRMLQELVAPYAETLLNRVPPFDTLDPTRERVAKVFAEQLAQQLGTTLYGTIKVEIEEEGGKVAYTTVGEASPV